MDYLFYCTGECEDALRDRDFYLVRNQPTANAASKALGAYFRREGIYTPAYENPEDDFSVFVYGENLQDGAAGEVTYCYRMTVVD